MNPPRPNRSDRFGLYLHIPFCLAKCPYCDFTSFPLDRIGQDLRARILLALERELDLALEAHPRLRGRRLDSIYFGGGTPSLLASGEIARFIAQAREAFSPSDATEVTLECNPTSAEAGRLEECHRAGVTRISLGVQSFDDDVLKALGRRHTSDDARSAIEKVKTCGFDSWGLDLIFGAPERIGRTPRESGSDPGAREDAGALRRWRATLEETIGHAPPHVSVYGLTLHEGTPMHALHARGEIVLPAEETQRRMFVTARRFLTSAGWRHYEISNYARRGHESRHNTLYWEGGEYLGLGAAAHSYFGAARRANPSDLASYLEQVEAGRCPGTVEEPPSGRSRRGETIMLALRQCEGVDPAELSRRIGCDFTTEYAREIDRLRVAGLLSVSRDNVRLTEDGLLLSDAVFEDFF
jgi:oxygen-independent coproporphyrinogen-3 oxidase